MHRLPCFLYRVGEHFIPPPEFGMIRPLDCLFMRRDPAGRAVPDPLAFREVTDPRDAAVFLFPWDIGQYMDSGLSRAITALIANLPYLAGRERQHIVCDASDFFARLSLPVCLFKINVRRGEEKDCIPMPYTLPAHMLDAAPEFHWNTVRYDVSFVGNATSPLRKAAVLSVRSQAPDLHLFVDFDNSFVMAEGSFHSIRKSPEETAARQRLYKESIARSLTVLCPPGIGPLSIRMLETMYLGRIPVLFENDAVYPFSAKIDYGAFCFLLPENQVMNTGMRLAAWLREQGDEALREKCVLACKTWNQYFSPDRVTRCLLNEARYLFWH